MASVVSTQSMQTTNNAEAAVPLTWRVRAVSAGKRLLRTRCWITYCCRKRKAAAAASDQQASVADNYFSNVSVATDNAVEAAWNAFSAAEKAAMRAAEAVARAEAKAALIASAETEKDAGTATKEVDDFTVIELYRPKSA